MPETNKCSHEKVTPVKCPMSDGRRYHIANICCACFQRATSPQGGLWLKASLFTKAQLDAMPTEQEFKEQNAMPIWLTDDE